MPLGLSDRNSENLDDCLHPETISSRFADLSSTTLVQDCVPTFTLSKKVVFILSAMIARCKLGRNICLEKMNMMSNYDVTNNSQQIQMTPYATE